MNLLLLTLALTINPSIADESHFQLVNSPGKNLVSAKCITCHSLDYIPMNSGFLDRKGWEAEVNKMIRVMGAPVDADEAKMIVDYLTQNYGINGKH